MSPLKSDDAEVRLFTEFSGGNRVVWANSMVGKVRAANAQYGRFSLSILGSL